MYPRVSRPGAYPTFQRIGTTSALTPYFVQNYMNALKWSLDNDAGDVSGSHDINMVNNAHIASHLLHKWGTGVAATDILSASSQFGSIIDAHSALDSWALDINNTNEWRSNLIVTDETPIKNVIANLCSQAPMFVAKLPEGGIYAGVYPEAAADADHNYYKDSDGNRVKIHPNSMHPGAADLGKPYAVSGFQAAFTPDDEIFNRFTVKYRRFLPTGSLESSQIVTETDGDCKLWYSGLGDEDPPSGDATDLAGDITDNLATVCASSQARYGVRKMPDINLDLVYEHVVATAFLFYLVKRYTNPRIVFSCQGGIEFSDLRPGHIIQVSNDMNYEATRPDYINQPAKLAGWNTTGATGVADYLVNRVRLLPASGAFGVEFSAEQIIYTPC
jgi:hypothetical protein